MARPAQGVLTSGDTITKIDSTDITNTADLQRYMAEKAEIGKKVTSTVDRLGVSDAKKIPLVIGSVNHDGEEVPYLGIYMETRPTYRLPFSVGFDTGNVGGPSAGLALTLSLVDELSPEGDHQRQPGRRDRHDERRRHRRRDRRHPPEGGGGRARRHPPLTVPTANYEEASASWLGPRSRSSRCRLSRTRSPRRRRCRLPSPTEPAPAVRHSALRWAWPSIAERAPSLRSGLLRRVGEHHLRPGSTSFSMDGTMAAPHELASSSDRPTPAEIDAIVSRSFSTSFRGRDPDEVRVHLVKVAEIARSLSHSQADLERRLAEAEADGSVEPTSASSMSTRWPRSSARRPRACCAPRASHPRRFAPRPKSASRRSHGRPRTTRRRGGVPRPRRKPNDTRGGATEEAEATVPGRRFLRHRAGAPKRRPSWKRVAALRKRSSPAASQAGRDEVAQLSAAAEDAAAAVRRIAEERAVEVRDEADAYATQMRTDADIYAERIRAEADADVVSRIEELEAEIARRHLKADQSIADARAADEAERAEAAERAAAQVVEAERVRERVLADLARKRKAACSTSSSCGRGATAPSTPMRWCGPRPSSQPASWAPSSPTRSVSPTRRPVGSPPSPSSPLPSSKPGSRWRVKPTSRSCRPARSTT